MRVHSKVKRGKLSGHGNANNPVFKEVFNALDVGILVLDSEGHFVDVNESYCRMLGYERRELIGKHFLSVVPDVQRDFTVYAFNTAMASPIPRQPVTEFHIQRKDGHIFGINCGITVITQPDGARYLIASITDITETNNYKHLLEETELAAGIGGWQLDVQTNRLSCTEGMYKLLDLPKLKAITWYDLLSFVGKEAYLQFKKAVQLAIEKGEPFNLDLDCCTDTANKKWIRAIGQPKQAFNKTIQLVGTFQDITQHKQAEELIYLGQAKYRAIANSSLYAFILGKPDGSILEVNTNACEMFGYTEEEFKKLGRYGIILHNDEVHRMMQERLIKGFVQGELTGIKKNGEYFPCEFSSVYFKDLNGEDRMSTIMRDISTKKKAEEHLLRNQQMLQQAERIASLGSWETDLKTGVTIWSDELYRIFGLESNNKVPTLEQRLSIIHPEDVDHVLAAIQRTIDGHGDFDFEHRCVRPDGSIIITHSQGQLIKNNMGEPVKLIGVLHDITCQKQAVEQLRQQEARHLEEKINHQRQITRATINTQEKERSEIGKELHDNVNQILASAKLFLSSPFFESDEREMFTNKAADHIHTAIEEIRKLSKSLVSPSTEDLGIIETINDMIGDIRWAQKIEIHFNHTGFDESKLDYGLKLTIYRIVQEQMNNILKYAEATKIAIVIKAQTKKLTLMITDNGKGFDLRSKRKGIGINNIINRADVFNGRVDIKTAPGKGCVLKVEFDK